MSNSWRTERDLLGTREVPASAYYGVHTLRAVENFSITGTPISLYPDLPNSLACVKQAAALANRDLGLLDQERARAIAGACEEIRGGAFHDQFIVDVIQGGAGTSTNMNANEVIANRALELMGKKRGDYYVLDPNEHVNLSQSTNDAVPTALKIAIWHGIRRLIEAMALLRSAFEGKSREFENILKMGRTQLQDAVPMTLGEEFSTYAVMLLEDEKQLREVTHLICEINMGATAVGTGINSHPDYAKSVCRHLARLSGIPFVTAPNLVEATQDAGAFVQVSSVLKRVAVKLSKVCNDLRLLSSGPRTGLGEINLPPMQAGSSIMPGKVNPVIPEVVNQIAYEVIGNDVTVTFAAEAGQLQLNAFLPIIAHSIFKSLTYLRNGCLTLTEHCVTGITANRERLEEHMNRSIGVVTALNPHIGYANATEVAQEALRTGRKVADIVLERELLTEAALAESLRPEALTQPRLHRPNDEPGKPLPPEPDEVPIVSGRSWEGFVRVASNDDRPATPRAKPSEAPESDDRRPYVSTGHLPSADLVRNLVNEAHARFSRETHGTNSQVYPALAEVPSELFGVSVVSVDGDVYSVGDAEYEFAIMSVSKPFVFALVCELLGAEAMREKLGVNGTGLPFNSLAAIERSVDGRTNPMVNSGAIATTSLVPGETFDAKWRFIHQGLSRFAGRTLPLNAKVYASASRTNARNQGIARLLGSYERLYSDASEATELYTKQCSLNVSAQDLAVMGATLADGGINPLTRERVVDPAICHYTLAVMTTAGMYETSGDWLYDVGLPGKSGIGGGIVTVSPGKGGLGTFAPPLDPAGNSVKGQLAAKFLSQRMGLDLFVSKPSNVVRHAGSIAGRR